MRTIYNRLKTYIKYNKIFLLIMLLGIIALTLQMREVVLYADDYIFTKENGGDLFKIWELWTAHYKSWGGGFTPAVVSILLLFGPHFWKMFIVFILTTFIGLTIKMVCHKSQKIKSTLAILLWSFIFVLSILVSRETIYWLDGSMAYLFTAFQAFLVFYFMFTRLFQGIQKKYDLFVMPIIAFFGGWSSAQTGAIAVFLSFGLLAWKYFVNKDKSINKRYYVFATLTLIGYLIFYFAPGNAARMSHFPEYTQMNLIEKIISQVDIICSRLFSFVGLEFTTAPMFVFTGISLTSIITLSYLKREKHKKIKKLQLFCAYYNLLFIATLLISTANIPHVSGFMQNIFEYKSFSSLFNAGAIWILFGIIPYIVAVLAVITNLINACYISLKKGDPFLLISLMTAYIAEIVMLMSPGNPLRSSLYTIMFMWVAITYSVNLIHQEKIRCLPAILLIFSIWNIQLMIVAVTIYVIISSLPNHKEDNSTIELAIFISFIAIMASANYAVTLINYHKNAGIYHENVSRIHKFKENESSEHTLYLLPFNNRFYGFDNMADAPWIEEAVINYYKLPKDLNLEYEVVK